MNPYLPPEFLLRFLKWFCHPDLHRYIEGDLLELYQERRAIYGKKRADRKLLRDVLLLFRPSIIKPLKRFEHLNHNPMLRSYLKIGFRNLYRHKGHAAIKIFGLSIGLAASFIALLFVLKETSYDKFHQDGDRIYRVSKRYFNGEKIVQSVPFRSYLLDKMSEEIPAIESITTLKPLNDRQIVKIHEGNFTEEKLAFAQSNFFEFFNFDLLHGMKNRVLKEPYYVVLSERKAREYFKDKSPVGQSITIENAYDKTGFNAEVSGVFSDMPENSHFQFDILISMKTGEIENEKRGIYSFPLKYGYLKLAPSHTITDVDHLIPKIEDKYGPSFFSAYDMHLETQAFHDIHLHSAKEKELEVNGDMSQLYLFVAIAMLILFMACFNYVNLTTATAAQRNKEIGVRKTYGARSGQLVSQFLVEAGLTYFLALLLAAGLTVTVLPHFNAIFNGKITLEIDQYGAIIAFLGIGTFVSIISGIYPALVLSRKSPKITITSKRETLIMRKGLTVLQFGISCVLIVATLVIFSQWKMLSKQKYSFNSEEIINIPVNSLKIRNSYATLKKELLQYPAVKTLTASNKDFISELKSFNGLTIDGKEGFLDIYYATIDADFFALYQKKIVSGRNFTDYSSDSLGGIILNESAAKLLGERPESVLGMKIEVYEGYAPNVIGVVEDFQFQSLHEHVVPMYFQLAQSKDVLDQLKVISVKVDTDRIPEMLGVIESTFKKFDQEALFEYSFLDDGIQLAYLQEKRFSKLLAIFTIIGIIIAAMGILGITIAVTQQRRKEFGVRKVLGASVWNIAWLINLDFLKLVMLANVLGLPLAYWLMNQWLQNFAHQIEIGISVFLATIFISVLIVVSGSAYGSVRAAISNPAASIRHE